MIMRKSAAAVAAALLLVSSPALAKDDKKELTGLELQQIQSRDFEVGTDVLFPAVMTVLQDSGYRILSADKDTGLISAQASTESKTTYNIFWGFGKKKKTPVVSAFIENRGPTISRVRLNFVLSETKSRVYGVSSSDEEPITDPAIYTDAFERIDKEVFVRLAMKAPAPAEAAPAQAPAVVPASTGAAAAPAAPADAAAAPATPASGTN